MEPESIKQFMIDMIHGASNMDAEMGNDGPILLLDWDERYTDRMTEMFGPVDDLTVEDLKSKKDE